MKMLHEVRVPQESVNDQSLIVLDLFFGANDIVKKGDIIAELETSKTTLTVEAEKEGFIKYFCKKGDELIVNSLIAQISDQAHVSDVIIEEGSLIIPSKQVVQSALAYNTLFSSQALEIIAANSLDKGLFAGRDFVSSADVKLLLSPSAISVPNVNVKTISNASELAPTGNVYVEKVSSNKQREIEYLSHVQSASLVSVINTWLDLTGVDEYLNSNLQYFKETILPIVIYECGRLLVKHRELNAYYFHGSVAYYRQVNVGFAIDIDKGLKVVGIRNTNEKTIHQIENEAFRLANLYQDNTLTVESLSEITFTITDLSGEGVFSFHPLINRNNAAILGISSIDKKTKRSMLSLAFDHRVTEGRKASIFLSELRERIESYKSSYSDDRTDSSLVKCSKCLKKLSEEISDVGFAEYIDTKGKKGYICQSCFKGF
jgi:pyruvate/2-oxoglutarate dehydrogenase complex dihydrolipoamide acyltransferase (E2) component